LSVIAVYQGIQTGPDVSAFNKLPCCKMTSTYFFFQCIEYIKCEGLLRNNSVLNFFFYRHKCSWKYKPHLSMSLLSVMVICGCHFTTGKFNDYNNLYCFTFFRYQEYIYAKSGWIQPMTKNLGIYRYLMDTWYIFLSSPFLHKKLINLRKYRI
jgi:hypothetical protein